MRWSDWAATESAIRAEFGYAVADDVAAARMLRPLVPLAHTLAALAQALGPRRLATVVGCGPSITRFRPDPARLVVAADGATTFLRERGIVPDLVVTDLDGAPDDLAWAAAQGAAFVVHAHGHNAGAIRDLAPRLGPRLWGTHQGPPEAALAPLANVGGFTDGDRAVVLLEHLGLDAVRLVGFDYDAPPTRYSHRWDPVAKPRKLAWAQRIVDGVRARGATAVEEG